MVLYEHSDVFQWGLNLLDGDPAYSPGYYGNIIQHDTGDIYNGHYFHNQYDNECDHVENDEIIARTLQEEFSQLEIAESSGYFQQGEQQFHVPETQPPYDWHNSSMMNYCSGDHDYAQEAVGDGEPSSSCSSPCETEEYSLELTDNYPLDNEVGRRLSQMIPIPHVPKINGEIPSIDEATSDHQRLLDRLQLYDFVENKVHGDGNCQFVRRQVVDQLKSNPEIYDGYVPMEYDDYLDKMSKSGEWGDHVTLQAAADSYGVRIFVMTSFKDTCCIEILPHFENPKGVIFLSFWAEVHYNSIYPQGDIPSNESRKKKRWWSFGSKH
ncbi:OVARIAN TUMOR DOMAIN-containing deubiquitinating enzyme 12 isoform X2 [Vigna umbellata]|uniref:OVARIAN TUMOR DOMAIN-containing deubiquitinating enzyme 12 isoform X2 n=1 Tax=Vigna umbellata TaxID=87088 RepID=UPI001F5E4FC3|nr:OVARIAN TUMOR DOMAIN-containing deubiquitinating enzyme 12 isoform X2 [Vigna umbellata]